jgi:hypothetical protein
MKHENIRYMGYMIQKRIDVKMNTCLIYVDDILVKCIAGAILEDGSENSIEKAKQWIDENGSKKHKALM